MGHVYRSLKPVPVPLNANCSQHDGTVSRYSRDASGHRRRTVIGCIQEPGMMFPNDKFRELYPDLWKEYYGENIPDQRLVRTGLYALSIGAGYKRGLYPVLAQSLGASCANALMDFAQYSIQEGGREVPMSEVMGKYMLFSAMRMSEAWYRDFFANVLSPEVFRLFRTRWLRLLQKEHGLESVWLCTESTDTGRAENAGSISGSAGCIWAADTRDGMPVACFFHSGLPSGRDLDKTASLIRSCNVAVKGVILDSSHASADILKEIQDSGLEYVVRLKPGTYGYDDMHARHAGDIYWKVSRLIDGSNVFGIAGQGRLFSPAEGVSCVGLFFSGAPGMQDGKELIEKIRTCAVQLQQRLARAPENVSVPGELREYLAVERDDQGALQVVCNEEACQKVLDNSGYFALASGSLTGAGELYAVYKLRLASERQFATCRDMLLRDTLGLFAAGMYSDKAAGNFFMAGFVAAVIRTEMMLACSALQEEDCRAEDERSRDDQEYDWDKDILKDLDALCMIGLESGRYRYIDKPEPHAERLLARFGITRKHLDSLAGLKICQDPEKCSEKLRPFPGTAPAGPGRPKGSRNRTTLEREQQLREAVARGEIDPAEKRGPGRPKGSRNKATIEREQQLREAVARGEADPAEKRGPGRPKGSRNRKTLERERLLLDAVIMGEADPVEKRGPGRPKGSRNKATLAREALERETKEGQAPEEETTEKTGRKQELAGSEQSISV